MSYNFLENKNKDFFTNKNFKNLDLILEDLNLKINFENKEDFYEIVDFFYFLSHNKILLKEFDQKYNLENFILKIINTNFLVLNKYKKDFFLDNNLENIKFYFKIIFLITKYLKLNLNNLNFKNFKKKYKKDFLKIFKNYFCFLENNFCEDFLLIQINSCFFLDLNIINLKILEEIEFIFDEFNFFKFNKKFNIKDKLNLGFKRYFILNNQKIILEKFDKKQNFKVLSLKKLLEYLILDFNFFKSFQINLNNYLFLDKLNLKKKQDKINFLKDKIKNFENCNFEKIIKYFLVLKNLDKKSFKKEFNNFYEILILFPAKVLNKNHFLEYKLIKNSIQKDLFLKYKKEKFLKKNFYIIDFNNILIFKYFLILK